MNERFSKMKTDLTTFWSSRTKKQKITYGVSLVLVLVLAGMLTYFMSRTTYAPLYNDVSPAEIGRIKEQLDSQGVLNKIPPGGTSILVPKNRVDDLLVTMAAQGFPESGNISYSFVTDNAGFGMTDNEFNIIKLASMQTELANLVKSIEGVKDAKVMITLPTESVFLTESAERATAVIVLKTNPGHKFTEPQIRAMYNLVSKSLPNLAMEDIRISNQYLEDYDLIDNENQYGNNVTDQMTIKKTVERDLQREVQKMLGTMMGQDKVVVSVTTDIDFKKENREEALVTPVDEENMEGIALSVQRITETFTGSGVGADGTPMAEADTDNLLVGEIGGVNDGEYERLDETINNEVNRIRREIVESPYKIRDIGIQVMIEPPVADDATSMPPELEGDIEQILSTIIRTSIDKEAAGELTPEEVQDKIVVSVHEFNGRTADFGETTPVIPWWVYVVGGVLLLVIIGFIFLFIRNRKAEELEELEVVQESIEVEDINEEQETEGTLRRKQLEKMAKEKPEEFAKLLRTWIAED